MTFTGFRHKPAMPSEIDVTEAFNTITCKVMAMLHGRAEVIVTELIDGALDMDGRPTSTTERLNDRIILDIEGHGSDFAAPCRFDEVLLVLGDDIPDSGVRMAIRNLDITPDDQIQILENLAIFAYFCGVRRVLAERFGMSDPRGPDFEPAYAGAGIVSQDAVTSILRHEIKRQRRLALEIGGAA